MVYCQHVTKEIFAGQPIVDRNNQADHENKAYIYHPKLIGTIE